MKVKTGARNALSSIACLGSETLLARGPRLFLGLYRKKEETSMTSLILCLGLLIQVPQDYPTITEAIDASSHGDTVLVHPGTYPEQLWLPSHDILLVSDFYFTGDSSALYNTVVDASAWADEDTASAVLILNGSTRATIFSGFTVTGGHGMWTGNFTIGGGFYIRGSSPTISSNIISGNQANGSTAIFAYDSSPVISGNLIYGNRGQYGPVGLGYCGSSDTPTIFESNNIAENPGFPDDPLFTMSPGFAAVGSDVIVRSNYFHDYVGCMGIAATFDFSRGELSGNIFENLHFRHCPGTTVERGYVVSLYHSHINILNNTFRNCSTIEGSCVQIFDAPSHGFPINVIGNEFENLHNPDSGGYSWGGLLVNKSEATVSHNKFTNCNGMGAMSIIIWSEVPRCTVLVTDNEFVSNDYVELEGVYQASAVFMGTDGIGKCILRGNTFMDNQKNAVNILYEDDDSLTYYLDAEQNYWGDSTGPYHPTLNPTGRGDTIAGRVDFDPWLLENDIDFDKHPSSPIPQDFALLDPYPNPFNPGVTLPLSVNRPGVFKVEIFDLLGRLIWSKKERYSTGTYRIYWSGMDSYGQAVAAGIYFARASSNATSSPARKLVLLK